MRLRNCVTLQHPSIYSPHASTKHSNKPNVSNTINHTSVIPSICKTTLLLIYVPRTYPINFEICTVCKHLSVPVVFRVRRRDCRYENQSEFTNPCRSAHNVVGGLAELNSPTELADPKIDLKITLDKVRLKLKLRRDMWMQFAITRCVHSAESQQIIYWAHLQ